MDFQHNQADLKIFPLVVVRRAGISFSILEETVWDGDAVEAALNKTTAMAESHRQKLLQACDQTLTHLPENAQRSSVYNARKRIFKGRKPSAAQFSELPEHLRIATADWQMTLGLAAREQHALEQAYAAALLKGYELIQRMAGWPDIRAALLYSSHDLLEQLPALLQKPPSGWRKKEKQTAHALARYVVRAASKTSPFSRFTTVGLQQENVLEEAFLDYKYSVTPNAGLLPAIYDVLLQHPAFFHALRIRLNPCITRSADAYAWLHHNGEQEGFQQTTGTPVLNAVVEWLLQSDRKSAFHSLVRYLHSLTDADNSPLEQWILDLIDTGFLEWELPESGLSPSWAGNLYQYLGALPAEAVIVETAQLLQWLRTVARTLPYMDSESAIQAQREAWQQIQAYFERNKGVCPDIPLESLFYEDVAYSAAAIVPQQALSAFAENIEKLRFQTAPHPLTGIRADFQAFVRHLETPASFLSAARKFLEAGKPVADHPEKSQPLRGKTGALLQPYYENGRWKAVVNALYPGGGKMLARWIHLFPASAQQKLQEWNRHNEGLAAFPFQGWYNTNFQPAVCPAALTTPGDRSNRSAATLLGNLSVSVEQDALVLKDAVSGRPLCLTELGLESVDTRPPAMQLLWHSGVPYVSVRTLLQDEQLQTIQTASGWRRRPRVETEHLVLARAAWFLEPADYQSWQRLSGFDFFQSVRAALRENGVPRRFFAWLGTDKPQYFDLDSPLLLMLFEKLLHRADQALTITEMWPVPDAHLPGSEPHAIEIALEWDSE